LSAGESTIALRPATPDDGEMVFHWHNNPFILAHGSSQREVEWEEHQKWFEETLSSGARQMFIVLDVGNPIGQVRFDRQTQHDCVVSVYLLRASTGRGWGVQAIDMACAAIFEAWDVDRVIACVRLDNPAGRSAFLKAGFREGGASGVCPAEHYSLTLARGSCSQ
jgi:RimJ/RimL family protein N-acetyltransferase